MNSFYFLALRNNFNRNKNEKHNINYFGHVRNCQLEGRRVTL